MAELQSLPLAKIVREFRVSAEMSQQDLAERSGLSVRQISDLERGLRVRPRIETIRLLADGLGLAGPQRSALFSAARPEIREGRPVVDNRGDGNVTFSVFSRWAIPSPSHSIIGRDAVLADLLEQIRLGHHRLITLLGPGGVGKTRLALELASVVQKSEDWAVLFVPLASILNPELVSPAVGNAAGLTGVDAQSLPLHFAAMLEGHRALLVLDNFEQILPAGPALARIVAACPSLQVLVTSRSPLQLALEQEWPIPPLALPDADVAVELVAQSPSVQLFNERSSHEYGDLTPESLRSVARICRRLDGVPLAIELAAARTRLMSPAELAERMHRTLPLLVDGPRDAPARLQTMRNAIKWSYDLLSTEEQRLVRRLGVFQGGFTIDAVEAIAPGLTEYPVIPLLETLVNNSLVQRLVAETGPTRFTMLEAVREFALEELIENGEESDARDSHLAWLTDQIGTLTPDQWLFSGAGFQHDLPNEQDNLRSALDWALDRGDPDAAALLAIGLNAFLRRNGYFQETAVVLERISRATTSPDSIIAVAVNIRLAGAYYMLGDFPKTRALAASALSVSRTLGIPSAIVRCLDMLGMVSRWEDAPAALKMIDEAIEISRASENWLMHAFNRNQRAFTNMVIGNLEDASADLSLMFSYIERDPEARSLLPRALANSAWVAGLQGHLDQAEALGREGLEIAFETGLIEAKFFAYRSIGEVALQRGEFQRSTNCFQSALRVVYAATSQIWEGFCLAELAIVAEATGDWQRAARLYGAAEASWTHVGISPQARTTMVSWGHNGSPSQDKLDDPDFAAAFAAGARLSHAEAHAEAMNANPG